MGGQRVCTRAKVATRYSNSQIASPVASPTRWTLPWRLVKLSNAGVTVGKLGRAAAAFGEKLL